MSVKDGDLSISLRPPVTVDVIDEPQPTAGPSFDRQPEENPPQTERPLDRKALTVLLVQHLSK